MGSPPVNEDAMTTEATQAPITRARKLNADLQDQVAKPYLARALEAVDPSHPNGTEGKDHRNMSVLQQHVAFFDRNNDGIVYPWETFQGFRAIGCDLLTSIGGAILINLVLSYSTQPSWIPNPLLPIYIKNIHKCKHGSDSETYDTEGRFEPSKFDAIFSKYGLTHPNALSSEELSTMLKANRNLTDFNGWILSYSEWQLLYKLGKDEKGLLHRETIRGVYDGSLFEQLEKKRASHSKRS
ncbi:peroxygenase-like [Dioscorea cayenensis subsp. rotundata]|uniref:Peroxygenase-like n=1 Tax=Dioscorea cayennensis subsp. rotundata TaxID=55577 RepID=A0AB40B929_DIOCR|nr:peroxygenase-like [Dioscorea cayenensis subsp. rotundata]